ncbi:MAG: ATP-dependent Clp protease ATP-binding subunit [Patescibacteria group bacterium]|nr:ATP-dependent Clp protease ATP-binding subunit [Patescibacteria group bacterium]MDE2015117.1 ATP-dependent Clp protease ATP-binding subunit [Patescibacteria group bacterium]MDE2226545.1 ATP-dependent Clp protease ATP-binding subunit [Patescibacteria group bacterium]
MQQEISKTKRAQELKLSFNDPRLRMSWPGRFLVRILSYIGYLVLAAATATFILSDLTWMRFFGIFLILFLLDRVMHLRQADKPLTEFPRKGRVNLALFLRPKAFGIIEKSFDSSLITRHDFFLELARQLLNFSEIESGLRRLDIPFDEFRQKIEEFLSASGRGEGVGPTQESLLGNVELLTVSALNRALESGHAFIELSDLFSSLPLIENESLKRIFGIFGIDAGDLERALIFSSLSKSSSFGRLPGSVAGFVSGPVRSRHRIMNRDWTSRPTPTLDRYSTDFTDLARQGRAGFLIGHKEELERLIDTLARPINPNALLIGESGIGKETLVAHLAYKLSKDEVPQALFDKRLVGLELGSLVAGAPPEELNQRLKKIIEEIITAGNIIIYIADIHNLVRTSGTAYLSAADELMPIIMNNSFPIIGATYPKEFKQFIEPRSDFAGAFEIIRVNEIKEDEAEKILSYDGLLLEKQFGVTISFGAVKKSVILAKKYFRNKFLPASAEELLKSAVVDVKRRGEKVLGPEQVIRVAEAKVNIPIHEASGDEAKQLLNLENIIHERLIDQEEAVRAVSESLREYRSGLSRAGGPISSFLFVGPTGVGKTELAKILARVQFGSEKAMVRFDMTEYQDKQSFYRFIGSPDGSVNGTLTDAILQKPYSLVLLDEFEKAFPDILNLFLQVLDDGRLTDNLGRVVDFQNTVIIATSNAHSDIINDALNKGQSMSEISEYLKKRLTDVFKPELINRFSRIVIFKNLLPVDLAKIVSINLQDVAAMVAEQGIKMEFDDSLISELVKLGYDPAFGARPLRRVIDEKLRAPLAQKILKKTVNRGSHIKVSSVGEEIQFNEIGETKA